jgi:DNA-binding NarL/FixJ family response regulator
MRSAFSELLAAIREVLNGLNYVSPLVAQHVVAAATDPRPRPSPSGLTTRQHEVLQLVADGYTAKEIANALNLSVKTAVFHKMAIMDKLGLRTTAELTRYAIEHGISATPRMLYLTAS